MKSNKTKIRSLDKKLCLYTSMSSALPQNSSWIKTIRETLGMTALQLAKRLGVTQPRVFKMEQNENNLKISTMKKVAEGLNCHFVYALVPKKSLENTLKNQALKKAKELLKDVNASMALENQLAESPEILYDFADELIRTKAKLIWEE